MLPAARWFHLNHLHVVTSSSVTNAAAIKCSAVLHICQYINETHWPSLLSGPLSSLGSSERACDDCSVLHRVQLPFNHPSFSNFPRCSPRPISLGNLALLHQYSVIFSHRGIAV